MELLPGRRAQILYPYSSRDHKQFGNWAAGPRAIGHLARFEEPIEIDEKVNEFLLSAKAESCLAAVR